MGTESPRHIPHLFVHGTPWTRVVHPHRPWTDGTQEERGGVDDPVESTSSAVGPELPSVGTWECVSGQDRTVATRLGTTPFLPGRGSSTSGVGQVGRTKPRWDGGGVGQGDRSVRIRVPKDRHFGGVLSRPSRRGGFPLLRCHPKRTPSRVLRVVVVSDPSAHSHYTFHLFRSGVTDGVVHRESVVVHPRRPCFHWECLDG